MLFLASFFFSEARKYPHFVNRDGTELSDSRERPRGSGSDPTRSGCSANLGLFYWTDFSTNKTHQTHSNKEKNRGGGRLTLSYKKMYLFLLFVLIQKKLVSPLSVGLFTLKTYSLLSDVMCLQEQHVYRKHVHFGRPGGGVQSRFYQPLVDVVYCIPILCNDVGGNCFYIWFWYFTSLQIKMIAWKMTELLIFYFVYVLFMSFIKIIVSPSAGRKFFKKNSSPLKQWIQ